MKNKINYLLILSVIILNCTLKQIPEKPQAFITTDSDELNRFFNICYTDIQKAMNVITDNKMIGMLTHLKKMDMEGKKYYLLERENLTAMIRSVTKGTYSDLILINSSGVIIYTMINDDIFGKSVKSHLKDTALNTCFNKSSAIGFYIEDVSMFPPKSQNPRLFISLPDKRDDSIKGIFIIQIDIDIINSLFKKVPTIIGTDGNYRIDKNMDNILKPYISFNKIDIENINKLKKHTIIIENNNYIYYPFNFNSLSWIIISED
jgi:hypothetical protein